MLSSNKVTSFTFLHSAQSDEPVIGSSAAFKTALDSQAQQLQTGLNGLIDALMNAVLGSSGAEQIGSAPISGVTGSTLYDQLSSLKTQINQTVLGQIPDGSLATAKYQDKSVTTAKIADNAVSYAQLSPERQMASTGGQLYAYRNQGGF